MTQKAKVLQKANACAWISLVAF